MIRLTISGLIFYYILFSVIIILLAWVTLSYKRARKKIEKEADYIWQCSVCFNRYIDSKHEDISVCPVCSSYNKRESDKGVDR